MIACKDINCRDNWYANEAIIDLAIRERVIKTKSGKPSLKYFDGATMSKYQFSTREWETVYCRSPVYHFACSTFDGIDPNKRMISSNKFEIIDEKLVSSVDIEKGDLLMMDEQVHSLHFTSSMMNVLESMSRFDPISPVMEYLDEYKMKNSLKYESHEYYIPSGLLNFALDVDDENEVSKKVNVGNALIHSEHSDSLTDGILNVNIYNPIISRRFKQAIKSLTPMRNVAAGEPIFV